MAALFLGGVIYKEKKKGERERKCVGLDGQQTSPEADFFFVFCFIFFGLMRVAAILAFGNNIRRLETYRIEARTSHSRACDPPFDSISYCFCLFFFPIIEG